MTITLNHTIIPASDKHVSAQFFARLIGVRAAAPAGPFVPVHVNDDLTFDFDDRTSPVPGHHAFLVDDDTFDRILETATIDGLDFGSGPGAGWDKQMNTLAGGRGVYVRDPDDHSYEFFTRDPSGA